MGSEDVVEYKFKLRGFTDTQIFLHEDLAPEDPKTNNAKSKAVSGHLPRHY